MLYVTQGTPLQVAETFLKLMSLLDATSHLCIPRNIIELLKAIAMSSLEFCQVNSAKYLRS